MQKLEIRIENITDVNIAVTKPGCTIVTANDPHPTSIATQPCDVGQINRPVIAELVKYVSSFNYLPL